MTEIKEQNRFLPPMRMHPAYRHGDMTPWGGEQLKTVFGKDIPDERTGEALEMSVIPGLESTDDDGVTLTALIERYGSRLTGLPEGTEFPLLLKLLAAKGTLSVQVHPDDEYAKAHENKLGKTEAWVILHAEEGASLLYGIREGVTIDDLRRALTGGEDVEPLIQRIPVKAGDVFYMPAGMVHAIGAGILLCEVQQSSNVTYRLYDYGRKDRYGQLRQLHLDKALDVLDTTARPQILEAQENEEGRARLCACKYFSVERQRVCRKTALAGDDASFTALMFLEGRGTVQAEDTTLSWKSADCFFVPAGRRPILLEGEGTLLVVRL